MPGPFAITARLDKERNRVEARAHHCGIAAQAGTSGAETAARGPFSLRHMEGVNAVKQMNRDNVSRTGETTDGETEAGSVRCDTAGIAADHGAPRGSSSARPAASCVIRPLRDDETELLKDFLYECIFVPDGKLPPRDIIERPEFRVYTDDFGTGPADNCLVAEVDGKVVGAVWTRIMNDYGHVDDETPSFAIALHKEYRGQGIGTRLMVQMLRRLKQQGYRRASLSVQRANYAVRMYEKVGFEVLRKNEEEYIMVRDLHSAGL